MTHKNCSTGFDQLATETILDIFDFSLKTLPNAFFVPSASSSYSLDKESDLSHINIGQLEYMDVI
jgi:hypothetical protein